MIKTGIIGYGYSAQTFHLPLIKGASKDFQLVALSTSKADLARKNHSDISIYSTAQALIQSSEAELVVITTPNDVHYSLAKECLQNGKHVILEKPMTSDSAQAEKLLTLANTKGLTLSIFHNRRWDGDFLTVKHLIQSGSLGDIRFFESHFDRFRPTVRERWREQPGPGAGIWFDLGSHLLDQALVLFGMPEAVTARCLPLRAGSEATDYFHVLLHYASCEVILHASPFSAGPNLRFQLQGSKGSFIKYGLDPQEQQLKNGMIPSTSLPDSGPYGIPYGIEAPEHFGVLYTESNRETIQTEPGCYPLFYTAIAASINNGIAPPVSTKEAIQVMKLIELAEASSLEKKTLTV